MSLALSLLVAAATQPIVVKGEGFHWGDAAIGAAAGFGAAVVLVGLIALRRIR